MHDRVVGFMSNIGPNRLQDGETVDQFCLCCQVKLRLPEGNIIGGLSVTVIDYVNDTGMVTVLFDRTISQSCAETLLDKDDVLIFGDFAD